MIGFRTNNQTPWNKLILTNQWRRVCQAASNNQSDRPLDLLPETDTLHFTSKNSSRWTTRVRTLRSPSSRILWYVRRRCVWPIKSWGRGGCWFKARLRQGSHPSLPFSHTINSPFRCPCSFRWIYLYALPTGLILGLLIVVLLEKVTSL